jgi:hypothetical protein
MAKRLATDLFEPQLFPPYLPQFNLLTRSSPEMTLLVPKKRREPRGVGPRR